MAELTVHARDMNRLRLDAARGRRQLGTTDMFDIAYGYAAGYLRLSFRWDPCGT